jgi:uncharacterized protein YecE (DUF72 family)
VDGPRNILVGTSGWQYADWRGRFYPRGLPGRAWLTHYAERFPTVEVNNSFYRLPDAATFARWRTQTPTGFVMAVKASRYITHVRRLRDCRDPVRLLWSRARRLGAKLGPVLFQLPPTFPADHARLAAFLRLLPHSMRAAFEFRHPSWFTDDTYALLDGAGAALVLADRPRARPPQVVTGGWAYLRFHQGRPNAPGYTREKLRRWANRIRAMRARDVFVYFNNDEDAAAPHDAALLSDMFTAARSVTAARSREP